MPLIEFDNPRAFDFAAQFLVPPTRDLFDSICRADEQTIEVGHPIVAQLLRRMCDGKGTVFPYTSQAKDAWIIVGQSRLELDRTLLRASRFVLPTYAEFANDSRVPILHAFDPAGSPFQRLGAALYSVGYYSWWSLPKYRARILERLGAWATLEDQRPALTVQRHPAYRDLYERFQSALAVGDWSTLEECLRQLQQYNLTTADNLTFLQIQAFARQQQWSAIWQRPDYETIANLRVPRPVRAALLTSLHHTLLLPLEQQALWREAFDTFANVRPRLGSLLTGQFGISLNPVLHVFAYEAAFARDRSRLEELLDQSHTEETRQCLEYLLTSIPPPTDLPQVATSSQRAVHALADRDYDTALAAAHEIDDPVERVILLMDIAFHSGDRASAEQALFGFWDLPQAVQDDLCRNDVQVTYFVRALEDITRISLPPPIQDWLDWFVRALANPLDSEVVSAADYLKESTDDRYWTDVRVRRVADVLLEFVLSSQVRAQSYARSVMTYFLDYFLRDESFPRKAEAYGELYETLYLGLFEWREVNTTTSLALLRLADARLRRRPLNRDIACANMIAWFRIPVPILEGCVLEALDMLAEYGAPGGVLIGWFREWVDFLLNLPSPRDRASLEAWLAFGEWVQPGADLLKRIRQALARSVEQDAENPIAALPAGYRITIFTLRPGSAERVRQALLDRNGHLDVRVCSETDLSDQVKALAQNSDMAVVVTTCITHTLTYGIGPYLQRDPVYPPSSGSTSILRAIEDRLR